MRLEHAREGRGTYGYASGASGTVNVPEGAQVFRVWCRGDAGGGTVAIDGGDATPVAEDAEVNHLPQLSLIGPFDVVFTGTISYLVEWIAP